MQTDHCVIFHIQKRTHKIPLICRQRNLGLTAQFEVEVKRGLGSVPLD